MKNRFLTGAVLTLSIILTAATLATSDKPVISDMDIANIAYTAGN